MVAYLLFRCESRIAEVSPLMALAMSPSAMAINKVLTTAITIHQPSYTSPYPLTDRSSELSTVD